MTNIVVIKLLSQFALDEDSKETFGDRDSIGVRC